MDQRMSCIYIQIPKMLCFISGFSFGFIVECMITVQTVRLWIAGLKLWEEKEFG